MKNTIAFIEILIIHYCILHFIIPDWDKQPLTKDYFALLVIGELVFDLYNKFKTKIK